MTPRSQRFDRSFWVRIVALRFYPVCVFSFVIDNIDEEALNSAGSEPWMTPEGENIDFIPNGLPVWIFLASAGLQIHFAELFEIQEFRVRSNTKAEGIESQNRLVIGYQEHRQCVACPGHQE
nr:putative integron gene cassette protein [uncultured bacterium]